MYSIYIYIMYAHISVAYCVYVNMCMYVCIDTHIHTHICNGHAVLEHHLGAEGVAEAEAAERAARLEEGGRVPLTEILLPRIAR